MLKLMLARKQKGLTQDELADEINKKTGLNLIKQNISYWETGKRKVDAYTLKYIAEILEVTTDFLLEMEGK